MCHSSFIARNTFVKARSTKSNNGQWDGCKKRKREERKERPVLLGLCEMAQCVLYFIASLSRNEWMTRPAHRSPAQPAEEAAQKILMAPVPLGQIWIFARTTTTIISETYHITVLGAFSCFFAAKNTQRHCRLQCIREHKTFGEPSDLLSSFSIKLASRTKTVSWTVVFDQRNQSCLLGGISCFFVPMFSSFSDITSISQVAQTVGKINKSVCQTTALHSLSRVFFQSFYDSDSNKKLTQTWFISPVLSLPPSLLSCQNAYSDGNSFSVVSEWMNEQTLKTGRYDNIWRPIEKGKVSGSSESQIHIRIPDGDLEIFRLWMDQDMDHLGWGERTKAMWSEKQDAKREKEEQKPNKYDRVRPGGSPKNGARHGSESGRGVVRGP